MIKHSNTVFTTLSAVFMAGALVSGAAEQMPHEAVVAAKASPKETAAASTSPRQVTPHTRT